MILLFDNMNDVFRFFGLNVVECSKEQFCLVLNQFMLVTFREILVLEYPTTIKIIFAKSLRSQCQLEKLLSPGLILSHLFEHLFPASALYKSLLLR